MDDDRDGLVRLYGLGENYGLAFRHVREVQPDGVYALPGLGHHDDLGRGIGREESLGDRVGVVFRSRRARSDGHVEHRARTEAELIPDAGAAVPLVYKVDSYGVEVEGLREAEHYRGRVGDCAEGTV